MNNMWQLLTCMYNTKHDVRKYRWLKQLISRNIEISIYVFQELWSIYLNAMASNVILLKKKGFDNLNGATF